MINTSVMRGTPAHHYQQRGADILRIASNNALRCFPRIATKSEDAPPGVSKLGVKS
ncbi:MAG: hypothetical protein JST44_27510 [Cyanobacteria bacterium SZAS LIN-5]|nr:hypothetical protein [Cyanobacteria bacterium SZAS LIN-5]